MPRSRQRGFTLLELMVTVGIVGILASVAIPTFQLLVMRAKTAERRVVMAAVHRGVQQMYIANGSIPGGYVFGVANPAWPPTQLKRTFQPNAAGWITLRDYLEVEGACYYTYYFQAQEGPPADLYVWAAGDLDGDNLQSWKTMHFLRNVGAYVLDSESPVPGLEDAATF